MDKEQQNDLALLREVLARELDTISQYEQASLSASDKRLQMFFLHLAREEKEHVSEAMALIHEYDADQKQEWDEHNTSDEHFEMGNKAKTAPDAGSAHEEIGNVEAKLTVAGDQDSVMPEQTASPFFTVGSLIPKR